MIGASVGHKQPQMTARYAHLDDVALREATDGFGAPVAEVEKEPTITVVSQDSGFKTT